MLYLGILTIPNLLLLWQHVASKNNGLVILLYTKSSKNYKRAWEVLDRGIDRMRKTKKQSVMLACVTHFMTCLGLFVWMKKYFFFYMEEALFCFQQMTWQRGCWHSQSRDNVTISGSCCNQWRRKQFASGGHNAGASEIF